MQTMKITEIRNMCVSILMRRGVGLADAEIIVDDYIDAELRGKRSHGLVAFSVALGGLEKRSRYEIQIDKGCYLFIDGKGDIGHIVARDAINYCIQKAREHGVGLAGIKNILRFSMPGPIAKIAADHDMIGIVIEYGGKAFMTAYGGAEAVISTNPLGVAIPTADTTSILIDMATSEKALGFVTLASKLGQIIPDTWGIDKSGNLTTKPEDVVAVVPFGGYKGYSIALALEVLSGPLVGVPVGLQGNLQNRGALLCVIDPSIFGVRVEDFKRNVSQLIREVKNSRRLEGVSEIFIPGEQGERRKIKILERGYLEIEDPLMAELIKLNERD
ncbi:MAG: putative oxidoreductase [Anaerolineaceae bacterium]|nr:MAG: putative oxidoreductase [Anaerolineaceae bacterium]